MPSWKVRSNSSDRAKSWITPARQGADWGALRLFMGPTSIRTWDRGLQRTCQQHPSPDDHAFRHPVRIQLITSRKESVSRGASRAFLVDLGADPRDLALQLGDPLLEIDDGVELQVLAH